MHIDRNFLFKKSIVRPEPDCDVHVTPIVPMNLPSTVPGYQIGINLAVRIDLLDNHFCRSVQCYRLSTLY